MPVTNMSAKINLGTTDNCIGRIGGNIPEVLKYLDTEIESHLFYMTFQNPTGNNHISIFVPKDFNVMLESNIYPKCSIKVFMHPESFESLEHSYTIQEITKSGLSKFSVVDPSKFDFITILSNPAHIQDERYYFDRLETDGYEFLLQIDEEYYPDGLLSGNYVFGFGRLYLYKHKKSGRIIAGYWQYS
jgi:hypothetical protein